jgi:hypothetical protein
VEGFVLGVGAFVGVRSRYVLQAIVEGALPEGGGNVLQEGVGRETRFKYK